MDSKRALRHTLSTMIAIAAVSVAAPTASAETRTASAKTHEAATHETATRKAAPPDAPLARTRHWTTAARPAATRAQGAVKGSKGRNKGIALDQVVQRAWSFKEFRCLDNLWTRESNWNHRAHNRSSGAYGIPQALPAGKMRGAGRDWKSNPETQIRWGLAYIKGRYGRPCGAWGHFRSHNWY
ncbi:lytic transglycosylase domain-containing protein [Nonomuraea rhizosphaerae]|uniref:aggregation-promoting factor C-terminal-like domain-containing protein n=1 Tax=Nonomuraea rhizosphaerae TaxID=2665663 RepID=UPI001C5D8A17|nr:lytic transglycosylase domain-containing protein [Nonomuraea rhizosphaerae]